MTKREPPEVPELFPTPPKEGEPAAIYETRRDPETGIVYERVIREIEQPPEDNITPFKEALRKLSKDVKMVSEEYVEPLKENSENAKEISAALKEIIKTIPAAMEQITALTSEITASEEFKKAQEIAALELRFRNRELKKRFYKETFWKRYEKKHKKEIDQATPEELEKIKKEFYKAPSWEDVLQEHSEAIQAASDTEIALSTREDGSVIIAGTIYEHYKNAWRDYLRAWQDAKITIIDNPTRLEGKPILQHGQVYNALFPIATKPEDNGFISLEIDGAGEEDKQNNIPVLTLIDIDFNDFPKEITKELTSFDGDIFSACFSLCREAAKRNGGDDRSISPCITTLRDIYNALGNDKAPGGNQLDNIISSISKLDQTRILINNDEEIANGYYSGSRLINKGWAHFIHVDYLPMTIKGKKGTQETLYAVRLSPTSLMDYIAKKGQYTAIQREYYSLIAASGLYMNDRAITVRNYIIKAIHTQTKTAGAITIRFETLCEKCNISRKSKDKQEKRATDKIIKPILDVYKDKKLIQDYKIIEKDKIIIQVEPAPKLETKKKPPKG